MTHPVVAALRSDDAAARRRACAAAAEDPSAVLLVDALVGALADEVPAVVHAAVRALERIGREHAVVLPSLSAGLRDENPRVRLESAWTWARLEPPPVKLLPAVVSSLEHLSGDARWRAARLLVELARMHGEVAPVVEGLAAGDQPDRVRRIALTALRELSPGSPGTLRAHLDASRGADPGLRRLALTGLAGLGPATPVVWSRLAEVIATDPDAGCRRVSATAIAALGAPSDEAREALTRAATSDPDASVRATAERVLDRLRASSTLSPA